MAGMQAADPTTGSGGGALGAVDRGLHRVEKLTALISGIGIFALMLIGVLQIFGRKFLNLPIYGYIDIVEIMMSFLVFMGLAYTERLGGHIRMEIILTFLKRRWQALFEIVGVITGLIVVSVLTYYSWQHFMRAYELGDSTMDAQLPWWPSKLVVPLSLGLLAVRLLVSLWGYARLLIWPDAPAYAVPEILDIEEQARREAESAEAAVARELETQGTHAQRRD